MNHHVGADGPIRDAFQLKMNDGSNVEKVHDNMDIDGGRNELPILSETSSKDPEHSSLHYSNLVDKIEKLERESEAKTRECEDRLREAESRLGISPSSLTPWRYSSGANRDGSAVNTNNNNMKTETFKLAQDMYSVLSAWEWNTKPFWASMFVTFLQFTLLSVLIADLIGGADWENILNLPGNVEYTVRIAQAVAVPVAVFKQEDLREGIEGLSRGVPHAFRGDTKFESMGPMKWRFGYFLRFGLGLLSMLASFILLMQAETVFDLLLNFLGIEFISDLDNLSFRLAGLGYFGVTTRDCVNIISQAEFRKDKKATDIVGATCSPSWCRKYAHILGVLFIFITMVSHFINYAAQQYNGDFLPKIVKVEFGDETLPYLGIFSGCYMTRSGRGIAERAVFEQMGRSTLQGKLAYCSDLDDGSWVLFYGEDDDACENFIVSSGSTKTFDVLETVESQWYTNTNLPLEYLQIFRVDDEFGSCGSLELLDATRGSCLEIDIDLEGRSSTFQKRQMSVSSDDKVVDAIRSHPIYVDADGTKSEVVIFTGRRWVLADLSKIGSWENTTTILDDTGNEDFYEDIINADRDWILSISEPVDGVNDQGTPLGLQWYFPRDISDQSNATRGFNVYISDLTRPVDLTCASCNSKANPCLYKGVCNDETGMCECNNGASGNLCRQKPSGDGTCNAYFNTLEFGYDSGDCCASTCKVSGCDDSRIAFPYGLDVLSKRQNESRSVWFEPFLGFTASSPKAFGYDSCKDPDQANFTIEIQPSGWKVLDPEAPLIVALLGFDADFEWVASMLCIVDSFLVTCDDKPYMEISSILVARIDEIECPTYRHTFQAPYGATCELVYTNYLPLLGVESPLTVKLLYGSDGVPFYENVDAIGGLQKTGWDIPASKCITDAFSNSTKSIFDKRTIEGTAVNSLSTSGRAIEWCESKSEGDRDVLVERFALEATLATLGATETYGGESHHCRVPIVGEALLLNCNTDDRVSAVEILGDIYATNGTLVEMLEFLTLLPQLELLFIDGEFLTGPIPVTQIANLENLSQLGLVEGTLTGTIPSEISGFQKLQAISFSGNSLTGEIPSELFSLERLVTIQLDNNFLTGPAIPSDFFSLTGLTTYEVSNNRLTGSIPSDIQNLPLIILRLDGNNITGSIPTVIGTLEGLSELSLNSNLLTGSVPTEIGNCMFVRKLNFSNSRLTGNIPTELGNLLFVQTLELQDNDLTGPAIFSELFSLDILETYNVSNNRLTGSIPPEVEKLGGLVRLHLDRNLLTGTIPSQCGNLQALTELTLFSNRLSGSIPFELANISGLELCDILAGNSNMTGGSVGVCS